MENLILLEKEIEGTGEVSGLKYSQIKVSESAYLYEVTRDGTIACFEVFKRKNSPICIDFQNRVYSETEFKETYPKSNSFGDWAWSYFKLESAIEKFNSL